MAFYMASVVSEVRVVPRSPHCCSVSWSSSAAQQYFWAGTSCTRVSNSTDKRLRGCLCPVDLGISGRSFASQAPVGKGRVLVLPHVAVGLRGEATGVVSDSGTWLDVRPMQV